MQRGHAAGEPEGVGLDLVEEARVLGAQVGRLADADVMRLKAEVISEQFKFESILALGAVDEELLNKYVPPPPPQAEALPANRPSEPIVKTATRAVMEVFIVRVLIGKG